MVKQHRTIFRKQIRNLQKATTIKSRQGILNKLKGKLATRLRAKLGLRAPNSISSINPLELRQNRDSSSPPESSTQEDQAPNESPDDPQSQEE